MVGAFTWVNSWVVNGRLFEIQFLNFIVSSKSAFEHAIITNSANNATDTTTWILCALSPMDGAYFMELERWHELTSEKCSE